MKTNIIYSISIVIVFSILAGASIDERGNLKGWFICAIIIGLVIGIYIVVAPAMLEKKLKKKRIALEDKLDRWYRNYVVLHGKPDKTIRIIEDDFFTVINVHDNSHIIRINDDILLSYKDIIGCTLTDNTSIKHGEMKAETTSYGFSSLNASVSDTRIKQNNSDILRDYTVLVNINNIVNPVIRIHVGFDEILANQIVALFNVIILNNK